jgi:hypothetical protein
MSNRVTSFVVTLKHDLKEEDARKFAEAISLFDGVLSVEPVEADFFTEQATIARVRGRVYEALAEAFDPKKSQKNG